MFKFITSEVVAVDEKFAEYLRRADIKSAKKGGAFVGNYDVAPDEFRKYGIVLPKGGMIIPDAEPDDLRAIVQHLREAEAAAYRQRQEEAEDIRRAAEQKIAEVRSPLLAEVQAAYDLLKNNAGPDWCLQALQYGEDEPSFIYHADRVKQFETAYKIGLRELPPITDGTIVFEWTSEGVARLTQIVRQWVESTQARRDLIWRLFVNANGIFTKTEDHKSAYAGKSFGRAMATAGTSHYSEGKWDEWVEITYYIGGEQVTDLEHRWLKSRSNELDVPTGYVRVDNGTNDLLRIPEMPGRNDVLVVEGKTDSRRGVWSYGEWFRGHPSKCEISFLHKGTQRKLKSVTLNGQVQESNWVNLSLWTDPRKIAKRALREAGTENPATEYVEALAEVYSQQIGK